MPALTSNTIWHIASQACVIFFFFFVNLSIHLVDLISFHQLPHTRLASFTHSLVLFRKVNSRFLTMPAL